MLAPLLCLALTSPCGTDLFDPTLAAQVELAQADQAIPVIVQMKERYDMRSLIRQTSRLRRGDRSRSVIDTLRPYAQASQAELSTVIAELEEDGQVASHRMLWNINAHRISATPRALEQLAAAEGVAGLRWDPPIPAEELLDVPWTCGPQLPLQGQDAPPFDAQPNIVALQAPQAWQAGINGRQVLLLNIDSGVARDHPDLQSSIWTNPNEIAGNGIDDDLNGYVDDTWGWDFIADDNDPYDPGHGTQTAGIVCGDGTNNGGVKTGMAPGCVMAVAQIIAEGDLLEAYQYSILIGADAITSSHSFKWTGTPDHHTFRAACEAELAAGITHANSIGNNGYALSSNPIPYNLSTPGNCPGPWIHPDQPPGGRASVMGCGGIWLSNDSHYGYSSHGPSSWEDITLTNPSYPHPQNPALWDYPYAGGSLPGLPKPDICAYTEVKTTQSSSGYDSSFGGTSGATPHLGGAICLLIDANEAVPPRQIAQALQETAFDLGAPGKDPYYGAGKIQVYDAVKRVLGAVTAYPHEPSPGESGTLEVTGPTGRFYALLMGAQPGLLPTPLGFDIEIANPAILLIGTHGGPGSPLVIPLALSPDPAISGLNLYFQLLTDDRPGQTGEVLLSVRETLAIQ